MATYGCKTNFNWTLVIANSTLLFTGGLANRYVNDDFSILPLDVNGALLGFGFTLGNLFDHASFSSPFGFMQVFFLVVLYLIFRRRLYAEIAIFILLATIGILFTTQSLVVLPFTLSVALMWTLLISRFGLIAAVTHAFVLNWLGTTLFTLNYSAWYATPMFVTLGLILFLLGYGFKVSTANRPIFGDKQLLGG